MSGERLRPPGGGDEKDQKDQQGVSSNDIFVRYILVNDKIVEGECQASY